MSEYRVPSFVRPWWRPWMGYLLALLGFAWATLGFFNFYFGLGLNPWLFNRYSEVFVVVIYGVPLLFIITDRYQRVRLGVIISLLVLFWFVVPVLWSVHVDGWGHRTGNTFPSWDVPGTWTNLGLFGAALLFGRRVKCGWMNACVAVKETAGAAFRKHTVRGTRALKYTRLKWVTGAIFMSYFVVILLPPSRFTVAYFYWFWTIMIVAYFGSLFLAPLLGSRAWCRFLCPILFGWANVLGFFRLRVDRDRCNDCGACEQVCDFGLPIRELSKKNPLIRTSECMGCGRCRSTCSEGAISYYDVRDFLRERLRKQAADSPQPAQEMATNHDQILTTQAAPAAPGPRFAEDAVGGDRRR